MTVLLWNIMLALSWAALMGEVTALSLAVGFVLGFVILYSVRRLLRPSRYFEKLWQSLRLAGLFAWELVVANLRIAYEVVTPSHNMRPGVVAIPLDGGDRRRDHPAGEPHHLDPRHAQPRRVG